MLTTFSVLETHSFNPAYAPPSEAIFAKQEAKSTISPTNPPNKPIGGASGLWKSISAILRERTLGLSSPFETSC